MDFEASTVIGLVAILAFVGGAAWLELLSRRQRRANDRELGSTTRVEEETGRSGRKVR